MVRCQVARPMVQKRGLLLRGLHRYETHARSADRFTDRLGICSIGLVPANVGFDVRRRDQVHLVARSSD